MRRSSQVSIPLSDIASMSARKLFLRKGSGEKRREEERRGGSELGAK